MRNSDPDFVDFSLRRLFNISGFSVAISSPSGRGVPVFFSLLASFLPRDSGPLIKRGMNLGKLWGNVFRLAGDFSGTRQSSKPSRSDGARRVTSQ